MPLERVPFALPARNALMSYGRLSGENHLAGASGGLLSACHADLLRAQSLRHRVVDLLISSRGLADRRTRPYLLVGWLWFLGTLVPVIGLVQVGGAALADRYTYFRLIGMFMAVAFGVRDLAGRFPISRKRPSRRPPACPRELCCCSRKINCVTGATATSLFARALAVTREQCHRADLTWAVALPGRRRIDPMPRWPNIAKPRLAPGVIKSTITLATCWTNWANPGEALAEYREAVRLKPELPLLHDGLGSALAELGRFDEAMNEFTNAARLDPAYPWPVF